MTLTYGRRDSSFTHRQLRLTFLVLCVGAVVASIWFWRIPSLAGLLYWQQKCARLTVPPGTVAYSADVRSRRLVALDNLRTISPSRLDRFGMGQAPAFLHELRTPTGRRGLVLVEVDAVLARQGVLRMYITVLQPATILSRPQLLWPGSRALVLGITHNPSDILVSWGSLDTVTGSCARVPFRIDEVDYSLALQLVDAVSNGPVDGDSDIDLRIEILEARPDGPP